MTHTFILAVSMCLDDYVQKTAAHIRSCQNDQPREDGEVRWEFGEPEVLDDLFERIGVPEEHRDDVAAALMCPRCGVRTFERFGEYGAATEWDEWYERERYVLDDFGRHLEAFPSLGLEHELGREILEAVAHLPRHTVPPSEWWRARHPDGPLQFTPYDLLPPPPEKARSEGRFNYSGQRAFYLASSAEGALAEVLDQDQGHALAWVQRFAFAGGVEVLDVRPKARMKLSARLSISIWGLLHDYLPILKPKRSANWKPSYIVTRFIADTAKYHGLGGLIIRSVRYCGDNLILFDAERHDVSPVGLPEIRHVALPSKAAEASRWDVQLDFDDDLPF